MALLEDLIHKVMTDKGIRTFCKAYTINPKQVITAPDQYVRILTKGKKPLLNQLDELREPIIAYLKNGHDPQTKRSVIALAIATAYATSPNAPPEWKGLKEDLQSILKSYVHPTNHF